MKKFFHRALSWAWIISLLVIILDQITKYLIVQSLSYGQPKAVLPSFNLLLLHNMGAAFSFLGHIGNWTSWLFSGFAILISALIIIWLWRLPRSRWWLTIALALILGGALGNLIDRIHYGYVIDFIQLYYAKYYWPAFNIADSAITVGAVMLAIEALWHPGKRDAAKK